MSLHLHYFITIACLIVTSSIIYDIVHVIILLFSRSHHFWFQVLWRLWRTTSGQHCAERDHNSQDYSRSVHNSCHYLLKLSGDKYEGSYNPWLACSFCPLFLDWWISSNHVCANIKSFLAKWLFYRGEILFSVTSIL